MSALEKYWEKIKRPSRIFLLVLLSLIVIPILSTWVGDGLKILIRGECLSVIDLKMFYGGIFGALVLAAWVTWMGQKLLPAHVIDQTTTFSKRPVVVALLSPCDNLQQTENGEWQVMDERNNNTPYSLSGKSLEELVRNDSGLPKWNWQQTLRAAYYHGGHLQKLVLVGSLNGSGKKEYLDRADKFFSTYFPGKIVIMGSPAQSGGNYDPRWQADFEDLDKLSGLLRNILRTLHKDTANYSDNKIIIDCTGGQKTASIAAALVTLDRPDLMFQYVGNNGHLIGFNVAGHEAASA